MRSDLPEIAVVDSHTVIWWLGGNLRRLGRRARAFCERVDEGRAVAVFPTPVLVELSEAIWSGNFTLDEPFSNFCRRLDLTPLRYHVAPLTTAIVDRSHDLFAVPERTDRLVAATAIELDVHLVTRDPEIAAAIGDYQLW